MSRQIRYYLLEEDYQILELAFASLEAVTFACQKQYGELKFSNGLTNVHDEEGRYCYSLVAFRPSDVEHLVLRPIPGGSSIDIDVSPVIEISKGPLDDGNLFPGRVYYTPNYWDREAGEWISKDADFVSWADSVFRRIRKGLTRNTNVDAYISKSIPSWVEDGGKLRTVTNMPVNL